MHKNRPIKKVRHTCDNQIPAEYSDTKMQNAYHNEGFFVRGLRRLKSRFKELQFEKGKEKPF